MILLTAFFSFSHSQRSNSAEEAELMAAFLAAEAPAESESGSESVRASDAFAEHSNWGDLGRVAG